MSSSHVEKTRTKDTVLTVEGNVDEGNVVHVAENDKTAKSRVDMNDEIMKEFRSAAMEGNWPEVIDMYKKRRELRTAKMTATEDTVLHMAVSRGNAKVVADILDIARDEKDVTILRVENDTGNTPLHIAASMGNVEMCKEIGGADPSLIVGRNIAGETPLFVAALYGKKEAFLWLHYLYMDSLGVSSTDFAHCIRDNDDTILHCAIAEDHFDVAIEIVQLYKDNVKAMMRHNEGGLSPLHILAAKRSAFRSTDLLDRSILVRPFYWLFRVEEKKQAMTKEELEQCERKSGVGVLREAVVKFYQGISFYGMRKMKEKHTWCLQIMNELLQHASDEYMSTIISKETKEKNESGTPPSGTIIIETPLMVAARNGVIEMVDKILESFPTRIKDENDEGKNIVLLAIEYRQTGVYRFLKKQKKLSESIFRKVDKEGNNALHLAARLGVEHDWFYPGEVLTMPTEINWFEYVKKSMPPGLLGKHNKDMKTPEDIFKDTHKELMRSDGEWVTNTSQACSVVSTLVVSLTFTACDTVPGGYDSSSGYAILKNNKVFRYFAGSSFVALFFSLMSTICFLYLVVSRSQKISSWKYVPLIFYSGMICMFYSILYMWVSFYAGIFLSLGDGKRQLDYSVVSFLVISLMIILFIVLLLTLVGAALSGIRKVPVPRRMTTPPIVHQRTKKNENSTDLGRHHT